MAARQRLTAMRERWFPRLGRRLDDGRLWQLLAALVAIHHLIVFHTTQGIEDWLVLALLVWGGALICIEDLLPGLEPRPTRTGLLVGSVLLVACLLRAARILHHDAVIYLLPPLEGLALALLCAPPRRLRPFAASLTCLALLPAAVVGRQLIPEEPLSLGSAGMATVLLQALGFDARVQGRIVALPGGSVSVAGVCNGTDLIMMVLTVAVIFLLAFPLRGWGPRLLVLAAAGPLAVLSNTVRIALLALIVATPWDSDRHVFDFFHEGGGSLVFAGIAVSLLGMAYLRLIDRQLSGAMEGGGDGDR